MLLRPRDALKIQPFDRSDWYIGAIVMLLPNPLAFYASFGVMKRSDSGMVSNTLPQGSAD